VALLLAWTQRRRRRSIYRVKFFTSFGKPASIRKPPVGRREIEKHSSSSAWVPLESSRGRQVCSRGFNGKAKTAPSVEAAGQGAHFSDTCFFQLKRHTGAGGFVWSSAVENDVVILWDFVRAQAHLVGPEDQGTGDLHSLTLHFGGMAQVHDCDGIPVIE